MPNPTKEQQQQLQQQLFSAIEKSDHEGVILLLKEKTNKQGIYQSQGAETPIFDDPRDYCQALIKATDAKQDDMVDLLLKQPVIRHAISHSTLYEPSHRNMIKWAIDNNHLDLLKKILINNELNKNGHYGIDECICAAYKLAVENKNSNVANILLSSSDSFLTIAGDLTIAGAGLKPAEEKIKNFIDDKIQQVKKSGVKTKEEARLCRSLLQHLLEQPFSPKAKNDILFLINLREVQPLLASDVGIICCLEERFDGNKNVNASNPDILKALFQFKSMRDLYNDEKSQGIPIKIDEKMLSKDTQEVDITAYCNLPGNYVGRAKQPFLVHDDSLEEAMRKLQTEKLASPSPTPTSLGSPPQQIDDQVIKQQIADLQNAIDLAITDIIKGSRWYERVDSTGPVNQLIKELQGLKTALVQTNDPKKIQNKLNAVGEVFKNPENRSAWGVKFQQYIAPIINTILLKVSNFLNMLLGKTKKQDVIQSKPTSAGEQYGYKASTFKKALDVIKSPDKEISTPKPNSTP